MASATYYQETTLLAWGLGQNPTVGPPVSTELALYTVSPTDLGIDGIEVVGGGYSRTPVIWNPPTTDSHGVTSISNSNLINFPQATADWGDIVAGAIFGIDNNGLARMLYYGPVYPVMTVDNGNVFQVLQNDLQIAID